MKFKENSTQFRIITMTIMQVVSKVTCWISKDHPSGDIIRSQDVARCGNTLVYDFSVEGNTHGAQEETGILVGSGTSVESDVATGDHLGRVPARQISSGQPISNVAHTYIS
jgi:hypothetical protein